MTDRDDYPTTWRKCEQLQAQNCIACTEQKTPQTCKRRIKLLDEGVKNNELRYARVEGSAGYEVILYGICWKRCNGSKSIQENK